MATAPFVISPALSAIAVAYPQGERIADQVLPRVNVDTQKFDYSKYSKGDAFRTPDTLVSRKGAPNQLDFTSTTVTDSVQDHALDFPIPNADIMAYQTARAAGQAKSVDPEARGTELLIGAVLNRREKRAADLVFNTANYDVANRLSLSGNGQWSDYVNSDPITAIKDKLDDMIVRPNYAVWGARVWSKLSRHPKIITGLYGSANTRGSAILADLAAELGLKEIYVGGAWIDTSVQGQQPTIQRCWGNHASFFYRAEQPALEGVLTFGVTAQWGDRVSGSIEDPDVGMRGGKRVRTGESVKELITANDLAFLFTNVVG